jgi:hypothetical protein
LTHVFDTGRREGVWRQTQKEIIMIGENRVSQAAQQLIDVAPAKASQPDEVDGKPDDSVMELSISAETVQHAQNTADIRENMPVIAACGKRIGVVVAVEGDSIKVTKDALASPGKPRYIPTDWIDGIEDCVHLNKNSQQVEEETTVQPSSVGA